VYDEKKRELEVIFVEVMKKTVGEVPMPPGNGVPYDMNTLPKMSTPDFTGMANDDEGDFMETLKPPQPPTIDELD